MSSCHDQGPKDHSHGNHSHGDHCHPAGRPDYLYWGTLIAIVISIAAHFLGGGQLGMGLQNFTAQVTHTMHEMWWSLLISVVAVGFVNQIPREMVMSYFGKGPRILGLFKATIAGTLFDLCNHGILVLAAKIYERGASLGQTMAFLIASPWNSFSLTLILYSLIGGELTLIFIGLSMLVAIVTGWIFDLLVDRSVLPGKDRLKDVKVGPIPRIQFEWSLAYFLQILKNGFQDSKMIFKWIFFGVLMSALVSTLMDPEIFQEYFGNSLKGMVLTLLAATGLEVCSEGFVPLAADLVKIAKAPGNAFIFLMAGVATDYTEILVIREATKSWKIAFFLPLITVPQIILLGYLLNL